MTSHSSVDYIFAGGGMEGCAASRLLGYEPSAPIFAIEAGPDIAPSVAQARIHRARGPAAPERTSMADLKSLAINAGVTKQNSPTSKRLRVGTRLSQTTTVMLVNAYRVTNVILPELSPGSETGRSLESAWRSDTSGLRQITGDDIGLGEVNENCHKGTRQIASLAFPPDGIQKLAYALGFDNALFLQPEFPMGIPADFVLRRMENIALYLAGPPLATDGTNIGGART
ncbi:hypothetical protein DL766_000162 [Monosporascus sp. MC13-8B]|uniref:Glucose-methanol-choline oxidoreductase N-terminal domain-containing protein n=1 Tax=Monosporascus cannonballus TaxID=155416 RepID=A0ABY0H7C1_9PEZI|nr:hypothetical protein DL762_004571 [Monosporascus cannonballus]RYO92234.1 hypothetical protein DL763_004764 [Monosporascus cannonballus]RYP39953.1 hypothetical protein DL766_000162 [Monosporascus sp. MC13-8B]